MSLLAGLSQQGNSIAAHNGDAAAHATQIAAQVAAYAVPLPSTSTTDGNYNLVKGGPSSRFSAGFQLYTFSGVQDRVAQFGYRVNSPAGDGDISGWYQYESDWNSGASRVSEIMTIWFGPTGVNRRPFFIELDHGPTHSPASGKPEGYTRFGVNSHETHFGGNPSGVGVPNGVSFLTPESGSIDALFAPDADAQDARIRVLHRNRGQWIGLTAGSGGSFGAANDVHSLDLVGSAGDLKTFLIRRSSDSGITWASAIQFHYSGRVTFGASADDGTHKYQFDAAAAFGSTKTATDYHKSIVSGSDLAGSDITLGRKGTSPMLWAKGNYGSTNKFSFLFESQSLYVNATGSGGGVFLSNIGSIVAGVKGSTVLFLHNNPDAVTAGGGNRVFFMGKAVSNPTAANTAGGFLFVDSSTGALKYMGPSGTVTQIAAS